MSTILRMPFALMPAYRRAPYIFREDKSLLPSAVFPPATRCTCRSMYTGRFDNCREILRHQFADRDQDLFGREAGSYRGTDQILQVGLDDVAAILKTLVRDRYII